MKQLTIPLAALMLLFISGCDSSSLVTAPSELRQAAKAFENMAKPSELSRSMFSAAFPNGMPSQYVSYLFSAAGKAEWPMPMDEYEADAMKSARITMLPNDLPIVKGKPDASKGMQLVIRYDDVRGVVIAEGYENPKKDAVLQKEWTLPKVKPALGVEMIYHSNREMGLSFQSD